MNGLPATPNDNSELERIQRLLNDQGTLIDELRIALIKVSAVTPGNETGPVAPDSQHIANLADQVVRNNDELRAIRSNLVV